MLNPNNNYKVFNKTIVFNSNSNYIVHNWMMEIIKIIDEQCNKIYFYNCEDFETCIVFKIKFEINLKFYFVSYNAKNNILSFKILFVGYIC